MRDNRKKCLICKEPMARWLFGMPDYEAIKEDLNQHKIILGGCCLSNHSPTWACLSCCISYRYDGIGYLDEDLINRDNFWEEVFETPPYQLPEKIQKLLKADFLANPKSARTIGFHFWKGGYGSSDLNIYYLDGILVIHTSNHYEFIFQQETENKLPDEFFILSPKKKKRLNEFIIKSKWKKNYVDNLIMDGCQWKMKRLFDKKIKSTYGSNVFPEIYHTFLDVLEGLDIYFTRYKDDEN
jgi:hypothetical protein